MGAQDASDGGEPSLLLVRAFMLPMPHVWSLVSDSQAQ